MFKLFMFLDVIRIFVTIQNMYSKNAELLTELLDLCSAYKGGSSAWYSSRHQPDDVIQL